MTAVSQYLSELDYNFIETINNLEINFASTYDTFTYYLAGSPTSLSSISLNSDFTTYLLYLDFKYASYRFTDIKTELDALHATLNTYTLQADPANPRHGLINITLTPARDYFQLPTQAGYQSDLADYLDTMTEIGPYATTTFLANPFPSVSWTISSRFGWRQNPTSSGREFHTGIDIPMPEDTPVYAILAGKVNLPWFDLSGYGNHLITTLDEHKIIYGHLKNIFVNDGQLVQVGDLIGTVGDTGRSTGFHLHLEYRQNNQPLNPIFFITAAPLN
jgi:murein DD-endopeptidase MepM/ murein hydrolase activator NlpD